MTVAAAGLLSACSLMGPSHSVKGEVVDASMKTVTIETADSKIYSFSTMDSDKTELNGLLLGKKIEVQFSGNYQDGMAAKKLSDIAKLFTILKNEMGYRNSLPDFDNPSIAKHGKRVIHC